MLVLMTADCCGDYHHISTTTFGLTLTEQQRDFATNAYQHACTI
jgi:hypothetical protein